jgi:cytoskeleton-associated protein 5
LLEHRELVVREEAKLLTVEIFRWIGAALKPQLASLKPVQVMSHSDISPDSELRFSLSSVD